MSQEEIIEVLEKKEEMTTEEIQKILKTSFYSVWRGLIGLLKELEVERRVLTKEEAEKLGKRFTGRNYVWSLTNEKTI